MAQELTSVQDIMHEIVRIREAYQRQAEWLLDQYAGRQKALTSEYLGQLAWLEKKLTAARAAESDPQAAVCGYCKGTGLMPVGTDACFVCEGRGIVRGLLRDGEPFSYDVLERILREGARVLVERYHEEYDDGAWSTDTFVSINGDLVRDDKMETLIALADCDDPRFELIEVDRLGNQFRSWLTLTKP